MEDLVQQSVSLVPTISERLLPVLPVGAEGSSDYNKEIRIPDYNTAAYKLVESMHLPVMKNQILLNQVGDQPGYLQFSGTNTSETHALHAAHSCFFNLALRTDAMLKKCGQFNKNMAYALGSVQEREELLQVNSTGGDFECTRDGINNVVRALKESQEKGRPPRQAASASVYNDADFAHMLHELGDVDMNSEDWQRLKSLLEFNRMSSHCHIKLYVEILLSQRPNTASEQPTPGPDGSMRLPRVLAAPEEAIGYRLSFHLLMESNEYERYQATRDSGVYAPLTSFDHGLEKMLQANNRRAKRAREDEDCDAATAKKKAKMANEPLFPCQKKRCLYTDIVRNLYPGIHNVRTQAVADAQSRTFKSLFTEGGDNTSLAKIGNHKAKIDQVSDTELSFFDCNGEERKRKVSCHVKDYYNVGMAITKKHSQLQPEQQDIMSYVRGTPIVDENNQIAPNGEGLDSFIVDTVNMARLFTEDGYMLIENADNALLPPSCHPERLRLMKLLAMEADDDTYALEFIASVLKEEAVKVLEASSALMEARSLTLEKLHEQIALFEEKRPWLPQIGDSDDLSPNPFYAPGLLVHRTGPGGVVVDEKAVSFKRFAQLLKKQSDASSKELKQTISDLNEGMSRTRGTNEELYALQLQEKQEHEAEMEQLNRPSKVLAGLIDRDKFNQIVNAGLVIDGQMMPQRVLQNCFFEVQIDSSYPNTSGKFIDHEFKLPFTDLFAKVCREDAKPRQTKDAFATEDALGASLLDTAQGEIFLEDGQAVVLSDQEKLYTDEIKTELDLHTEINMITTSPTMVWGQDCRREHSSWMERFEKEGIANYQQSFTQMLQNWAQGLWNEQYTREDMCERTCALREGCHALGVFGSIKAGTLQRISVHMPYDVGVEASVNAKQTLMYVYSSGYRQAYTQRTSLAATMVVLATCDPTVGEGASKRQTPHVMLHGPPGLGKSMILQMLLDLFVKGFVRSKGKESAKAYKVFSKKLSLLAGANLYDEGSKELRVDKGRGANKDTGSDEAEGLKERMSSGEARTTTASCVKLATGEAVIKTIEVVRQCRQADIRCDNDTEDEVNNAIVNRCFSITLSDLPVDVSPDELASAEPPHGSAEWHYQDAIRGNGRLLVAIVAMLHNMYGAMASYATVFNGIETSALAFMRKAITAVLERNGQSRFKARRIGQVTEMMKVNRVLGVAYETFYEPWGLFSKQTVQKHGGARGEFWVQHLFRDPQLYWVGKMCCCSFQDALAACVMGLNQDRIEDVNNVRDAMIIFAKKKSYYELFGPDDPLARDFAGRITFNFNAFRIPLDGIMKNEQHALNSLANRLLTVSSLQGEKGPLEGYTRKQVADVLMYIIDENNDQLAYQTHPDNLDMLLVDKTHRNPAALTFDRASQMSRGMPWDCAGYTARELHEYGGMLYALNSTDLMKNDDWAREEYKLDEAKLNACKEEWKRHNYDVSDSGTGRMYFPNAYFDVEASDTDLDSFINVKTLDISRAVDRGFVRVSTQWLFDGMRRTQHAELQKEIVEEYACSSTNSGYYATGGVGQTNIKRGGPHLPDVFYVRQNDERVCSIYNTNQNSQRQHSMFCSSMPDLPESMKSASVSLEPQVPESLQMIQSATEQMIQGIPVIVPCMHWFMQTDSRSRIIVADYLLLQADKVYREWCTQGKAITLRELTDTGEARTVEVSFSLDLLRGDTSVSKQWMQQRHLLEVLMWMFDTPPEDSPYGFRHLCRCYLTAAQRTDLGVAPHTEGLDMFKTDFHDKSFFCYKKYLSHKMIAFYKSNGEGRLVYNAMNKIQTDKLVDSRNELVKAFNQRNRSANHPAEELSVTQICKLATHGGKLDPAKYNSEQNRLRLKIIDKNKELKDAQVKKAMLCKQLEKELGMEASEYKTYLESRTKRADRVGVHSGEEYIAYLEITSLRLHKQRMQRWGKSVCHEYE